LAAAGGFDVAEVLGSKSTYLRAGIGGWQGRALQKGDVLPVGSLSTASQRLGKMVECGTQTPFFATVNWAVSQGIIPEYRSEPTLRVLKGSQFEAFTLASRHDLFHTPYQVTLQSDRMGYRLQGAALSLQTPLELISEGVAFGTIQVPPEGQPIILMADRQTTGGYPKIADVISVDLPLLAQVKPGESVRFVPVGLEEAQELYIKREWEIRFLKQGIQMRG
jgi:antagonist of KipI